MEWNRGKMHITLDIYIIEGHILCKNSLLVIKFLHTDMGYIPTARGQPQILFSNTHYSVWERFRALGITQLNCFQTHTRCTVFLVFKAPDRIFIVKSVLIF